MNRVNARIGTVAAALPRPASHRGRLLDWDLTLAFKKLFVLSFISVMAINIPARGDTNVEPAPNQLSPTGSVFEMPAHVALQQRLIREIIDLFRNQRYAKAEKALRSIIVNYPNLPLHHYNLAAALARQKKLDAALESLDTAISLGFMNRMVIARDPDFGSLRELPRFRELLAKLTQKSEATKRNARRPIIPRLVQNGRAIVDRTNTIWEPRSNSLVAAFKFTESAQIRRIYNGDEPISRFLNHWYDSGEAAGNHGDLYDNRDNGHSLLSKKSFPQLSYINYSKHARAAGMHYGVNSHLLFNAITFGNSSTAITGSSLSRSQARLIMTTPGMVARAYQQYVNNHLYVLPEHRDHDPEMGDLFPANTPYMIVSQGSSGSDRPFLHAVGAILAAFKPDVKAFLRAKHLIMPTVQMIFRFGLKSVDSPEDYMSAKAHPSVFKADDIDIEKMIHLARDLRVDTAPPQVKIEVIEASKPNPGIDYFGPAVTDEFLFDTPSAVARVVRSTIYQRRMVISTATTTDPNGLPLKFTWKVLRGDADRISIRQINSGSSVVELQIPWHRRRSNPFNPELTTDRVDIAVFAYNGEHYSAPAFVTFNFPPTQARQYDRTGRILEIDYAALKFQKRYVDPILYAQRVWRDRYHYAKGGQLIGWYRTSGQSTQRFTRHGARVVETDARGRPSKAERIRYDIKKNTQGLPQVIEVPTGKFLAYRYRDASDWLGAPCTEGKQAEDLIGNAFRPARMKRCSVVGDTPDEPSARSQ